MPIVLGYHGCSLDVARTLLAGAEFTLSAQSYDWLGRGVYFWEEDPLRAYDWACARNLQPACLVGAAIDPGRCLDLTRQPGLRRVRATYERLVRELALAGKVLPRNVDARSGVSGDLALRRLDKVVIDYANDIQDQEAGMEFQTVRALYPEGEPLYPGAGFRELTHVQICVRDTRQVMGVFRVPEHQRTILGMPELYGEEAAYGTGS